MTTHSGMPIPRTCDIIARALDLRESAVRLHDDATARQIDRLIAKLPAARLCWVLGVLHIASPSGGRYQVTRAGCSCLNAQRCGKRACWHLVAFEVLLDMLDTLAESADMQCDPPGPNPEDDSEGDSTPPDRPRQPWYARTTMSAARASCWAML